MISGRILGSRRVAAGMTEPIGLWSTILCAWSVIDTSTCGVVLSSEERQQFRRISWPDVEPPFESTLVHHRRRIPCLSGLADRPPGRIEITHLGKAALPIGGPSRQVVLPGVQILTAQNRGTWAYLTSRSWAGDAGNLLLSF